MKLGRRIKTARYKKITKRTKRTNFRKNTKRRCKQYRHKKRIEKYSRKLKYNKRGQMGGEDDDVNTSLLAEHRHEEDNANTTPVINEGKSPVVNPQVNPTKTIQNENQKTDFEPLNFEYKAPLKYKRDDAWFGQSKIFNIKLKFGKSGDRCCLFILKMTCKSQIIEVGFVVTVADISSTSNQGEMVGKIFYWPLSNNQYKNNKINEGIQKLVNGQPYPDKDDEIKLMLKLDTTVVGPDVFPTLKPNLIEYGRNIVEFLSLRDNDSDKNTCKFYVKENNDFFKNLIEAMFRITGVVCYHHLFSPRVVQQIEKAYDFNA
jgi:hypothetical protein